MRNLIRKCLEVCQKEITPHRTYIYPICIQSLISGITANIVLLYNNKLFKSKKYQITKLRFSSILFLLNRYFCRIMFIIIYLLGRVTRSSKIVLRNKLLKIYKVSNMNTNLIRAML